MNYKVVLQDKLKSQFGHDDYKNYLQKKAIEAVYIGKKDVYICMPSGFGKSLCFQLPVTIKENSFAIVISPTIAHAKNQVDYLKSKNILAYNWNTYTPKIIKMCIKKDMRSSNPKMKLLYITPEQYISSYFQLQLRSIRPNVLSYFVIDEVHCLSPWSHDFRQFYRKLFEWPQEHPCVPIVAVTATAIKEVREDIFKILKMKDPLIFSMPVFRSNLFYDVWFIDILPDPLKHLKQFIEESLGLSNDSIQKEKKNCGIIFCQERDTTVSLANALNSMGIQTLFYDTRCNNQTRFQIQHSWSSGEANVIITTNNFGIGITKQTVRFIVHWYNISSIGNYYQESGRAGHDGKKSYCRIYCYLNKINKFTQNFDNQKTFISLSQNQQFHLRTKILLFIEMIRSIIGMECRHAIISKYFEDLVPLCENHCDVCKNKDAIKERISQLEYFNQFKSTFNEVFENYNFDKYKNLNDFRKLPLYEKSQINIYADNQNEIKVLLKNLHKLETRIYNVNKESSVMPIYRKKFYQYNCIDKIQENKISEYIHKESNSFAYKKSNIELQLETINKILYEGQIKETSTSMETVTYISDSTLSNVHKLDIERNDSETNHIKKIKTVRNNSKNKIECSTENEEIHSKQFRSHSCYISVELQLEEINKILYSR